MQDNRLDTNDFINNTLRTTLDPEKGNVSDKSSVLGPYNSTDNEDETTKDKILAGNDLFYEDASEVINFLNKVLIVNRDYEAANNADFDDGVEHITPKEIAALGEKQQKLKKKYEKANEQTFQGLADLSQAQKDALYDDSWKPNQEVLAELQRIGFEFDHIKASLSKNEANHCSTTYFLL